MYIKIPVFKPYIQKIIILSNAILKKKIGITYITSKFETLNNNMKNFIWTNSIFCYFKQTIFYHLFFNFQLFFRVEFCLKYFHHFHLIFAEELYLKTNHLKKWKQGFQKKVMCDWITRKIYKGVILK